MPSSGMPSSGMPSSGMPGAGLPGSSRGSAGDDRAGDSRSGDQNRGRGADGGATAESGEPGGGEQVPYGDSDQSSTDPGSGDRGRDSDEVDFSEEESGAGSASGTDNPTGTNSQSRSGQPPSAESGFPPAETTMTAAERAAVLEGELDESIASYDGMILRERGYILNRGNREGSEEELESAGAGGVPYDDGTGEGEPPFAEGMPGSGAPPQNDSDSSGGGYGPNSAPKRAGDYQHRGQAAPPPADIPDGSDDDVVARQIREAAMRETDPELREKLWDEYRKYKNQTK